jgi:hypothetical protein
MTPKDFYKAQTLRNSGKSFLPLFQRILLNEKTLDEAPSKTFKVLIGWAVENIFQEKILSVENWLEVAFHLCKQRWDSSIDWLETQPMSKINAMLEVNKKFVEDQEEQMKKKP